MPELDPDVLAYYERGGEAQRLLGGFPSGPLELARTQELILRELPDEPRTILDVGGGPGVHAAWLAERGHRVTVVDPVPLHVTQAAAAHPAVDARLGDARQLDAADASVDVVLLLGPLYHLLDVADRRRALAEARRVLRPGGLLFAAAISRYAALLDMLVRLGNLHEPHAMSTVTEAVRTGVFKGAGSGLFTNAYFHLPSELASAVDEAGFADTAVFNVEGPGFLADDFEERWADPDRRAALLAAARLVESEPELLAAASHLLAVARVPRG